MLPPAGDIIIFSPSFVFWTTEVMSPSAGITLLFLETRFLQPQVGFLFFLGPVGQEKPGKRKGTQLPAPPADKISKKSTFNLQFREVRNYPWKIECFLEDLFLGGQSSIILGYRRLSVKSLLVQPSIQECYGRSVDGCRPQPNNGSSNLSINIQSLFWAIGCAVG